MNTIQIKRGVGTPTPNDLNEYEIGYSTTTKKPFINDNGTIRPLTAITDVASITIPVNRPVGNLLVVTFQNIDLFTDSCSVFITPSEQTSANNIKIFNKANLFYSRKISNNQLGFLILGGLPAQATTINVKVTVIY